MIIINAIIGATKLTKKAIEKAITSPREALLYAISAIIWLNSPAKYATALAGAIVCEGKALLVGKKAQRYAFAFTGIIFASSISTEADMTLKLAMVAGAFYMAYKRDHENENPIPDEESDDIE